MLCVCARACMRVCMCVCVCKAIADGPVGQVLARPLFFKVKRNSILQKASDYWSCIACYITIQHIEKGYDEVKNNWLLMLAKYFMQHCKN